MQPNIKLHSSYKYKTPMNFDSTHHDLLRYHYNEMPKREKTLFEMQLKQNPELQYQYQKMCLALKQLDTTDLLPSKTSVDISMGQAQAQHPELQ